MMIDFYKIAFNHKNVKEVINPFSHHWSLSVPPETIRKLEVFCFQRVWKETVGMKRQKQPPKVFYKERCS